MRERDDLFMVPSLPSVSCFVPHTFFKIEWVAFFLPFYFLPSELRSSREEVQRHDHQCTG